jgi:hypothetical protein
MLIAQGEPVLTVLAFLILLAGALVYYAYGDGGVSPSDKTDESSASHVEPVVDSTNSYASRSVSEAPRPQSESSSNFPKRVAEGVLIAVLAGLLLALAAKFIDLP